MHTDIVLAFFIVVWHIICSKQVVKRHFNDCKTIKKMFSSAESERPTLTNCEIIFEEFQPM